MVSTWSQNNYDLRLGRAEDGFFNSVLNTSNVHYFFKFLLGGSFWFLLCSLDVTINRANEESSRRRAKNLKINNIFMIITIWIILLDSY